jgi:hypothetical protein
MLLYCIAHHLTENITDSAILHARHLPMKHFKSYLLQEFFHIILHVLTNIVIIRCLELFLMKAAMLAFS